MRFEDYFVLFLVIVPTIFLAVFGGFYWMESHGVQFQRPYLREFEACQSQLAAATTPQCAPVECKEGDTGILWVWTILGVLLYAGGLYYWNFHVPKKHKETEAELKARAEAVRKREESVEQREFELAKLEAQALETKRRRRR